MQGYTNSASLQEAMLVALQAPNELHGVQIHIYEDRVVARELAEVHNIRLESKKADRIKDEQLALYAFLCNFQAYSSRLPSFAGKCDDRSGPRLLSNRSRQNVN